MHPSPDAIKAIRAKVSDWKPDNATIADSLNTPSIANPVTVAAQIPRPFTASEVLGSLLPETLPKLLAVAFLPDIRDKIQANDPVACNLYATLLYGGGVITEAERDSILAIVSATHSDPTWQPLVPWSVVTLGREVDAEDVAESREA